MLYLLLQEGFYMEGDVPIQIGRFNIDSGLPLSARAMTRAKPMRIRLTEKPPQLIMYLLVAMDKPKIMAITSIR